MPVFEIILMRRKILTIALLYACTVSLNAQVSNIAERLGYDKGAKLLIIHADDLGVAHAENAASILGLEQGTINSASIMVPCPWFPEIAAYARKNKNKDLGLHLTLNSEWSTYKWTAVSPKNKVSSLVNQDGYFYASVDSLVRHGKSEEVAIELRNQVNRAYDFGIDVTHLDTHMGAAVSSLGFLKTYIELGQEFGLPTLLVKQIPELGNPEIRQIIGPNDVILDNLYTASPRDYTNGMSSYYRKVLRELPSGLNCLLVHLAYNNKEMQAITTGTENWGAAWRKADFDFFTSDECKEILQEEKIILVSWREIRDKITRVR